MQMSLQQIRSQGDGKQAMELISEDGMRRVSEGFWIDSKETKRIQRMDPINFFLKKSR